MEPEQLKNLNKLKKIIKEFHKEADNLKSIKEFYKNEIDSDTIVLESGHQPNFLPYTGTWKKAFLLDFFMKKLNEIGKNAFPLFGFPDYNLCTAPIIYKNKIPALTKTGCKKIGFKISKKDRYRMFNCIEKPSENEWEKEIERIKEYYKNNSKIAKIPYSEMENNFDEFEEIMWKSYKLADNFADVNAFFFSKVCNEIWGLNVLFFRYSDIQKEKIFIEEWKKIISNLNIFNKTYNDVLIKKKIKGIPPCLENSFPFWYHCRCGGKVALFTSSENSLYTGKCQACNKNHEISIENLDKHFPKMSMNAVARNLIVSNGLGTTLFISGSGGGLRYGAIANEISKKINFNLPITLAWKSKDYYIGIVHFAAINALMKLFDLRLNDILDKKRLIFNINGRMKEFLNELKKIEKTEDEKLIQSCKCRYINKEIQIKIIKDVFGTTPSILDISILLGNKKVMETWKETITDTEVEKDDEFYKINKKIIYDNKLIEKNNIPIIYHNLNNLDISG